MAEKKIRFDYSLLYGKIRSSKYKQSEIARQIGISASTLSLALNNKREFSHSEIVKMCDLLGIPNEEIPLYFFCLEA